jgi:hypothetical protein
MNDPLDNVPKTASNVESVMGATSKEDVGNLKTSGRDVEDAGPPSQKGKPKEVTLYHCPFPWTIGAARAAPLFGEIHDFFLSLHCSLDFYMKFTSME